MKRFAILLLLLSPVFCQAQRGVELRFTGGYEIIGVDPWLNGGIISGTVLYNINGVLALGASYSNGIGNRYNIEEKANYSYDAALSELALDAQVTFLRVGKVKLYGMVGIGQVKGKTKELVPDLVNGNFFDPPSVILEDKAIGFGLGAGGILNLGGGFYLNFLEYRFRTLSSDFLQMDKGFQGSVGPMHTIKTGISYILGAK